MIRIFGLKSLQEAEQRARDLLYERVGKQSSGSLLYITSTISYSKVADSFSKEPTTPFDVPRNYEDEKEYFVTCVDEETNEKKGVVYIYSSLSRDSIEYSLTYRSPEEIDPSNFTIPFRSLSEQGVRVLSRLNVLFSKPVLPLSPEEAQTPKGEEAIALFLGGGGAEWKPITKEQLQDGSITKESLFHAEDEEIEENPEDYPEEWKRNIVLHNHPSPRTLSEATGMRTDTPRAYAKALEKVLGSPLDDRERREVIDSYEVSRKMEFIDYATYEFFRTESYDHLKEVLSHFADFGLRKDWERNFFLLEESKIENWTHSHKQTAEERIVSQYVDRDFSTMIGASYSYREISEATGIPLSLIYRATRKRVWD